MGGSAWHLASVGKMGINTRGCEGEEREAGSETSPEQLAVLPLFLAAAAAAGSWQPRETSAGPAMPRAGWTRESLGNTGAWRSPAWLGKLHPAWGRT